MSDLKGTPGGEAGQTNRLYHDEGDGTHSESFAAHLRGWDATDGAWYRLPIDHASGALKVALGAGTVDIGIVDQGTGGSSAWKVTDPALTDGTQRVGGTVAISAASLPLPTGAAKDSTLTDSSQRIGGTVAVSAVSLPLPTGAATEATLAGVKTGTDKIPSGLTVTSTRLLVDGSGVTQPVSGTFWQTTQPVSGTFWQTTQPVSIATMPSTPVTGSFFQTTQPVSGTVVVSSLQGAQDELLLELKKQTLQLAVLLSQYGVNDFDLEGTVN